MNSDFLDTQTGLFLHYMTVIFPNAARYRKIPQHRRERMEISGLAHRGFVQKTRIDLL